MNKTLAIRVGWMIDGTGAPVRKNILLAAGGGRIISIRPYDPVDQKQPDQLDFSDCTLIPGLVDSHVHLFMSGSGDPVLRRQQLETGYAEIKKTMQAHIEAHLRHGVLAVRDGGDYGDFAVRFKKEYLDNEAYPGYLKVAGKAWHASGRYGKMIGQTPGKGETLGQAIIRRGPGRDQVKIINSGLNSLRDFGKETLPQFSSRDLEEAYQAAGRLGSRLMVHANGRLPVKQALEAGCDSIEHGFFMGEDNLRKMAAKGIFWVPTAVTMKAYGRMLGSESIEAEIAGRNLEHQLDQIGKAREYGLKLAAGTDAGSLGVHHGRALTEEIGLFLEAGMTIEEAIKCVTHNGAVLLGIEEEIGRIRADMPASFVLFKGEPSLLPNSLLSPERVYFKGKLIYGN